MLPIEDSLLKEQYNMACYCVALACLLEFCAESPVFVSQVFCFVKLRVVISTLQLLVRSSLFLILVLKANSFKAIQYFAWAQITSALTVILCYYGFYFWYIKGLKRFNSIKKKTDNEIQLPEWNRKLFDNMDDFPFQSVNDLLPGVMLKQKVYFLFMFNKQKHKIF